MTEYYNKYLEILKPIISDDLYKWIISTDIKIAPASTKYHGSYVGGLLVHKLLVRQYLYSLYNILPEALRLYDNATLDRVSLLHDLCKLNTYKIRQANKKSETGNWIKIDEYYKDDPLPLGHGEKSIILILQHNQSLSNDEMLAIRHHMGAYNLSGTELLDYNEATIKCPLVLLLHTADMMESRYTEFKR